MGNIGKEVNDLLSGFGMKVLFYDPFVSSDYNGARCVDLHVASLLDVEKGTPLLFVKSVVYTSDGNTVFVGTQTINAERFKLII